MEKPDRYETESGRLTLTSHYSTVGIDDGDEVFIFADDIDEVITYLLYWKKWYEGQDR